MITVPFDVVEKMQSEAVEFGDERLEMVLEMVWTHGDRWGLNFRERFVICGVCFGFSFRKMESLLSFIAKKVDYAGGGLSRDALRRSFNSACKKIFNS